MSDMDVGGVGRPDDGWLPPPPPPVGEWGGPPGPSEPTGGPPPRRGRAVLAMVVAGLVLLSAGIGIGWGFTRGGSSTTAQAPIGTVPQTSPSTGQTEGGLNVQAIADRVAPAVVDINTVVSSFAGFGPRAEGAGTGIVLTSSGEVLTNNHVIQGATSIKVTVAGHSGSYTATVLGADPTADVALLQIQGVSGLQTATLADSSSLTLGQEVVAIGNALGQGGSPTVTDGTITSLNRSITVRSDFGGAEHLSGMIQTDAPISPGDSGGPLVNSAGQVVGMITAGATGNWAQSTSHVGFAIPTNTSLGVVNQIRAGHATDSIIIGQPGFLGVQVRDMDAATAAQLGLNVTSGALVVGVIPGTPAADSGMPQYAVITAIDGQKIASAEALGPALYRHKPGQRVQVTWVDRNGSHTVTVRLVAGPAV